MNVIRKRQRTIDPVLVVAAALGMLAAPPALALEADEGHALARQWCASCHQVEPSGATSDLAPGFQMIADDPERTPERLRTWLSDPHPPMPKLPLSREEIDAILAYLDSLRGKTGSTP